MIYSFSIHNGNGSTREELGSLSLADDSAALVFGNDVIRDMLPDTAMSYSGWMMDVVECSGPARPARAVCSIMFPLSASVG